MEHLDHRGNDIKLLRRRLVLWQRDRTLCKPKPCGTAKVVRGLSLVDRWSKLDRRRMSKMISQGTRWRGGADAAYPLS
jgi:hypothetical protein